VNYDPHSHEKLANELVKAWYGRDNPELVALGAACMQGARPGQGPSVRRNAPLPAFWTNMYAAVLEAERALLYTVGFDFNVEIVHTHMARLLKRPRFEALKKNTYFQQQLINIANDIYKKDSTLVLQVGGWAGGWLAGASKPASVVGGAAWRRGARQCQKFVRRRCCLLLAPPGLLLLSAETLLACGPPCPACLPLQYPVDKIALASFYLVFKGAKVHKVDLVPQPEPGAGGVPWYIEEGLGAAECIQLTNRLTSGLIQSSRQRSAAGKQQGGGSGKASVTAAGTTAMLGPCESTYSAGGLTMGGGGGDSMAGGLSEPASGGAGEHTSVPPPLSSDVASGSKRPAEGPPGGTAAAAVASAAAAAAAAAAAGAGPGKRARLEPAAAASNEATSAALHTASVSPPSQGAPAAQPARVPAAAPAAVAAAAPGEESEKEEGELEEGEL
jgi:hypothetical protein